MSEHTERFRKKRHGSKKLDIFVFFAISILYMELVLKVFCCPSFFNLGLIFMALFSVSVAFLFKLFCSFLSKKGNRIIAIVILSLLFLLFSTQVVYQKFFGKFLILFSLIAGGADQVIADGLIQSTISAIMTGLPAILLLSVPLIFYCIWGKRFISAQKQNWQMNLVIFSCSFALHFLTVLLVTVIPSANEIYNGVFDPNLTVPEFGLLRTEAMDFKFNILGLEQDITLDPITSGDNSSDSSETSSCEPEVKREPNVMDIDFSALAENETDEDVKMLHEYFGAETPTYTNEYTGMFKGYNLIHITAEGFSPYAVDKELTPTLYKMMTEGFQFKNFYTPVWGVSTSDGEYVGCTGLIPKSGVWSFYESGSNYMPFCLGNQFAKLGVTLRNAYHNHTYSYYHRDISHPNMGYTYKGLNGGLTTDQIKPTWPESDLEMIEATAGDYIQSEKQFVTYYMTVSGHLQYTKEGNAMSKKNWQYVEHLDCSDTLKAYYACNIELDRAMESLLAKLNAAGIADKTVIAISPDHYPYGLLDNADKNDTYKYFNEMIGHEVETNFELYKGIFILYNQGMEEPIVVDKLGSSLDILPTLSNLFGLEYDSRLLMGKDILSDEEPIIIFSNRSWITDKGRYNTVTRTFELAEGQSFANEEEQKNYIARIKKIVDNRFKVSTLILDTDYYGKVFQQESAGSE